MSRNRFLLIVQALHFAKNAKEGKQTPRDRLWKIKPSIDLFNNKMNSVSYPGREFTLDESMVPWQRDLVFRHYIKNKKHEYDIKLYMVNTPEGFVDEFADGTGALDEKEGKDPASNSVLHLMSEKLGNSHPLYMDNFYNSYDLARQLLWR
ncbi:hypothetical protein JTB14_032873 [Gonioctena quinquepunctata]|nr:hypothetical protein JTB14_032873 [Gonioctena quinquepunctata]